MILTFPNVLNINIDVYRVILLLSISNYFTVTESAYTGQDFTPSVNTKHFHSQHTGSNPSYTADQVHLGRVDRALILVVVTVIYFIDCIKSCIICLLLFPLFLFSNLITSLFVSSLFSLLSSLFTLYLIRTVLEHKGTHQSHSGTVQLIYRGRLRSRYRYRSECPMIGPLGAVRLQVRVQGHQISVYRPLMRRPLGALKGI